MNQFLLLYRFSHPTVEEVINALLERFTKVTSFRGETGEVHFLIETPLPMASVLEWIEAELPYSIREIAPAQVEKTYLIPDQLGRDGGDITCSR